MTREDIWGSLWNRHCYASTRERILLQFEIDDHVMGDEFQSDGSPRCLAIGVYGTTAIETVEIIKNNQQIQS